MSQSKTSIIQPISFKGRVSRRDYWIHATKTFFLLFFSVIATQVFLPTSLIGTSMVVINLFGIYIGIMELGMSAKRLHDIGRSGKWWFVNIIPFFGSLYFLYLTCKKGESEENRFGPPPSDDESFTFKSKDSKKLKLLTNTFRKNTEQGLSEAKISEILVQKGYDYNDISRARDEYKKVS